MGGTRFVYRELGIDSGVPVIFLNHLAANLDNWDPRVVDGIAAKHRVITATSIGAFCTQLKAIHSWGLEKPADLSQIQHPVLVANGDDDRMVPTSNSFDLARRLPNPTLRIYPDAGHGGIFQAHERFVPEALAFLEA